MGNILEEVTIPMHPEIADIKKVMMENGAVISMMSGSGPTVFGFFDDEDTMKQAKEAVEKSGLANVVRYTSIYNV
jgi:4-diphosphocytidyl-2-C-methyl-D-erythritol kinase